jgi:hypothetical protein
MSNQYPYCFKCVPRRACDVHHDVLHQHEPETNPKILRHNEITNLLTRIALALERGTAAADARFHAERGRQR